MQQPLGYHTVRRGCFIEQVQQPLDYHTDRHCMIHAHAHVHVHVAYDDTDHVPTDVAYDDTDRYCGLVVVAPVQQ